mgnify:CR=1 FL=1
MQLPKAIAVVGPTACGKTKLGVFLASKFKGEIVSADSRQIYRHLDLCTGKDKNDYFIGKRKIPYHLIDIIEPNREFSSADFQKKAFKTTNQILAEDKLPILVGGSPFYVYSVTEGWDFPKLDHDPKIREKIREMSLEEKQRTLKKIDPAAYEKIDRNNPRRLERALEICLVSGKKFEDFKPKSNPKFDFLFLGKIYPLDTIRKRVEKRLKERFEAGMIDEVAGILKENKASAQDLDKMGLEPRFITYYLEGHIDKRELEELLLKNIVSFAKRQITWFKKDKRVHWIEKETEANKITRNFLKNS